VVPFGAREVGTDVTVRGLERGVHVVVTRVTRGDMKREKRALYVLTGSREAKSVSSLDPDVRLLIAIEAKAGDADPVPESVS